MSDQISFDEEALAASLYNNNAATHAVRYLAALFPDDNKSQLPYSIRELLRNSSVDYSELMTLIRGRKVNSKTQLNDLRNVMRGISLRTTKKVHSAVDIEIIQAIGFYMARGNSVSGTARALRVSLDLVHSVDNVCGFSKRRKAWRDEKVVEAVQLGLSSRQLSRSIGISKSLAHDLMADARRVHNTEQAGQ